VDPKVVTKLVANISFSCCKNYLETIQIAKWSYIGVDKFITVHGHDLDKIHCSSRFLWHWTFLKFIYLTHLSLHILQTHKRSKSQRQHRTKTILKMKSPGVTTMNLDRLYKTTLLFIPTECNAHSMRWSQRNIQLLPIPYAPVQDSFDKIIRTATSSNTTGNYVIHWWWDWNPIWWSIRVLLSAAEMCGKKHNMWMIKSWPVPANEKELEKKLIETAQNFAGWPSTRFKGREKLFKQN
jgi:hypothetical protein